jgi:ABC-type sulfate transport system permease subunit
MLNATMVLAQQDETGGAAVLVLVLLYVAAIVVVIAGLWKMFEKANQPGWGALIPIYNVILLLKIAGKPVWWIVLMFIPFVNIVVGILVPLAVARNFGRGAGFGVGLIFLPFIFYPILGFGQAQYNPVDMPTTFSPSSPAGWQQSEQ